MSRENPTQRRIITERVLDCFDFDGRSLSDVLLEIEILLTTSDYTNLRFAGEHEWDCARLELLGDRPETDEEFNARLARSERAKKGWESRRQK